MTESTNRLIYRYSDRSVPPEYHRSYTITLVPGRVDISIDVYGKIISENYFALDETRYKSFLAAILDLNISNREEINPRLPGSSADELDIYIGQNYAVKGSTSTLHGDVRAAAILFKALIPDLQKIIDASIG